MGGSRFQPRARKWPSTLRSKDWSWRRSDPTSSLRCLTDWTRSWCSDSCHRRQSRKFATSCLKRSVAGWLTRALDFRPQTASWRSSARMGTTRRTGARPLRRCITAMVEDYISDAMLKGELQSGDIARMDIDDMGDVNCTKVNPEEVEPEEIEIVYSRVVDEV